MYRCPRCDSLSIHQKNALTISEMVDCSVCEAKLVRKRFTGFTKLMMFYPWIASVSFIALCEYMDKPLPLWANFGIIFFAFCLQILFAIERTEFVGIENVEKLAALSDKEVNIAK